MSPFFAALGFLTILPLPPALLGGERELGRSLPHFPLVGLLLGVMAMALDAALVRVFPMPLASALLVIALLAVSGGLHLDGLADTADGFFSARSRERMLEIMRDSRSGPMGVIAIAGMLLLKTAALASLPGPLHVKAALLMPLAGRCALVVNMNLLPYARPQGLASVFHKARAPQHGVWAALVMLAVGGLALSWAGLAAGAAALAAAAGFAAYTRRKIGGLTGDTLGAACEIVEVVPALLLAAWAQGKGLA